MNIMNNIINIMNIMNNIMNETLMYENIYFIKKIFYLVNLIIFFLYSILIIKD